MPEARRVHVGAEACYVSFQMTEGAVPKDRFEEILPLIDEL